MTKEEQMLNGFTEMMRGLWNNQDLKVPDIETLKSKMTLEEHITCEQEPCADLCKSCDTKGCIFQSGIKREKCDFYTSKKCGMSDEQIRTVIGALTCEDAISRAYIEPLVEELENICINGDEHVLDILSNIKNAPPVTPQQKVGKWIETKRPSGLIGFKCSECGNFYPLPDGLNFCPNCGTKMEVGEC